MKLDTTQIPITELSVPNVPIRKVDQWANLITETEILEIEADVISSLASDIPGMHLQAIESMAYIGLLDPSWLHSHNFLTAEWRSKILDQFLDHTDSETKVWLAVCLRNMFGYSMEELKIDDDFIRLMQNEVIRKMQKKKHPVNACRLAAWLMILRPELQQYQFFGDSSLGKIKEVVATLNLRMDYTELLIFITCAKIVNPDLLNNLDLASLQFDSYATVANSGVLDKESAKSKLHCLVMLRLLHAPELDFESPTLLSDDFTEQLVLNSLPTQLVYSNGV